MIGPARPPERLIAMDRGSTTACRRSQVRTLLARMKDSSDESDGGRVAGGAHLGRAVYTIRPAHGPPWRSRGTAEVRVSRGGLPSELRDVSHRLGCRGATYLS